MKFKIIKDVKSWNNMIIVPSGAIIDLHHSHFENAYFFYYRNICYKFDRATIIKYVKKLQKRAPLPLP